MRLLLQSRIPLDGHERGVIRMSQFVMPLRENAVAELKVMADESVLLIALAVGIARSIGQHLVESTNDVIPKTLLFQR